MSTTILVCPESTGDTKELSVIIRVLSPRSATTKDKCHATPIHFLPVSHFVTKFIKCRFKLFFIIQILKLYHILVLFHTFSWQAKSIICIYLVTKYIASMSNNSTFFFLNKYGALTYWLNFKPNLTDP